MLALIVNPHAGGGRARRLLPAVREALHGHGLEHRVELTQSIEHARQLTRAAVRDGADPVAFGGDGLIGAVAGALRGSGAVLGILPGGRGNDLVRVLGIPPEPVAACEILVRGQPRDLDLGAVGEATFIGIASCGFDSEANRIANQTRVVRGSLVYAYGALRALLRWRPAEFEVELDDDAPRRVVGYSIAAANSKAYGGGMMLAPAASLSDGLLDVVIIGQTSKLRFLRLLPTVFRGEHVHEPEVETLRAAQVRISASRPFTLYADGDPVAPLPVTIRALGGVVRIMVPS